MAANPLATPLFLGLGVDELSMIPSAIPKIKKRVMELSQDKCSQQMKTLLKLTTASEIRLFLTEV